MRLGNRGCEEVLKIEYLAKGRDLDFRNLPAFIDLPEFLAPG